MKVINYLLGYKDLYIVQDTDMFNFSLDSVLLPNFVRINKKVKKVFQSRKSYEISATNSTMFCCEYA